MAFFKGQSAATGDINIADLASKPTSPAQVKYNKLDTQSKQFQSDANPGGLVGAGIKVEDFFTGLYQSTKKNVTDLYDIAKTGVAEVGLGYDTAKTNEQTANTSTELKRISQLPSQQQRRNALAKMGTPSKYLDSNDWKLKQVDSQYKELGIDPTDNAGTMFRKGSGKIMSAEFGAFLLAGPAEAVGKGLLSVAADAITGAGVKVVVRTAAEVAAKSAARTAAGEVAVKGVTQGVAETVGEKILQQSGDQAVNFTIRRATEEGTKVMTENVAKKIFAKAAEGGIINSTASIVDDWSKGNDFKTPQERTKAFHDAGIGFIMGSVLGSVFTAGGEVTDTFDGTLSKLKTDINKTKSAIYKTNVLDKTSSDLQDQYKGERSVAFKEIGAKGLQKQKQNRLDKSNAKIDALGLKVHDTHTDAIQNLKDTHGVEINAVEPGGEPSGFKSGKNGITITHQIGNYPDAMNQVGRALPSIAAKLGFTHADFEDELAQTPSPDLGITEMDSKAARMQKIMAGMFSKLPETWRTNYPRLAALKDGIYGVVDKTSKVDAIKAYAKDNFTKHYQDLDHLIQMNSGKVQLNELTGKLETVFDPKKHDALWEDAYSLMSSGKPQSEVIKVFQKQVDRTQYVADLRDQANSLDQSQGKEVFQKADAAAAGIKKTLTPDGKVNDELANKTKFWQDHLKTFYPKAKVQEFKPMEAKNPAEAPIGEPSQVHGEMTAEHAQMSQEREQIETSLTSLLDKSDVATAINQIKNGVRKMGKNANLDAANFPKISGFGIDEIAQAYRDHTGEDISTSDFIQKVSEIPTKAEIESARPKAYRSDTGALPTGEDAPTPEYTGDTQAKAKLLEQESGDPPSEKLSQESLRAADLVSKDYQGSIDMLLGTKGVPTDIANPESFRNYLHSAAIKEAADRGDTSTVTTLNALNDISGKLQSQALGSRRVQAPNSLDRIMNTARDIIKARVAGEDVVGRTKGKVDDLNKKVETDKQAIIQKLKDSAITDEHSAGFIDTLTC